MTTTTMPPSSAPALSPTARRIVDTARGLIQRGGYNGFSYDDIARELDIKKPSVHHHFRSKALLGAVVVRQYLQDFRLKLAEIERREPDLHGQLQAYVDLYVATYGGHRLLCPCGMLSAEASELPEEVQAEVTQFLAANLDWLTARFAQALPAANADGAQALALSLLSMLMGSMVVGRGLHKPDSHRSDTVQDVGRTALALFLEKVAHLRGA